MTRDEIRASQSLVASTFQHIRPDLMAVFGNVPYERKDDSSPVTQWDVAVETAVRSALARDYPALGFEGEETGVRGNRETYWLIDPIDGTSSFIRGLHYSTNMAALIDKGEAVAAVIYDFVHDDLYTARKGEGAYKNGVRLGVNAHRKAGDWLMYSFSRQRFPLIREALQELAIRTVLPMGAAGHSYTLLAEGKIDGLIALGTGMGAYDNAPGVLLAEEAGAQMLQYDDETGIDRHEFILGAPALVEAIEKSGLI